MEFGRGHSGTILESVIQWFLKQSQIIIISPIFFNLKNWENGNYCNSSSEKHLRNPNIRRGS
jgi:hypothetical protein